MTQGVTAKSPAAEQAPSSEASPLVRQRGAPLTSHGSVPGAGQHSDSYPWVKSAPRLDGRGGRNRGGSSGFPRLCASPFSVIPFPCWLHTATVPGASCLPPTAIKFSLQLPSLATQSFTASSSFTRNLPCQIHAGPPIQALLPRALLNWQPAPLVLQRPIASKSLALLSRGWVPCRNMGQGNTGRGGYSGQSGRFFAYLTYGRSQQRRWQWGEDIEAISVTQLTRFPSFVTKLPGNLAGIRAQRWFTVLYKISFL